MPMPKKRRHRRRRQGLSRRRLDEDGASLSESLVDSDSSSSVDGGSPPPELPDEPVISSAEPRYHQIIASRLARLQLPDGTYNSDLAGRSILPSSEILEALTRRSFHDDESRAAWLEYQCQIVVNESRGPDRESGESDSAVVDMGPTYTKPDDITEEQYLADCETLRSRMTEIDTYNELDEEQIDELHLKYALRRIKACLLLKGKPADELDDVALEREYPPKLIEENDYFLHYVKDGLFGWYFDSELCNKKHLIDYQRLVLLNDDGGDEYTSWRAYKAFYSTPEADRDYLQYWETIVKEMKWLEDYVLLQVPSLAWAEIRSKALFQAIRIAVRFPHMTLELAGVGFHEYIWKTRIDLKFVKYLDCIFLEIWKRINEDHQLCFRDALEQVYDKNLYPALDRTVNYALNYGDSGMEEVFGQCTKGLSERVPDHRARELIAHQIRWTRGSSGTYEKYARKKLRIAELLGLISKDKIAAA